MANVNRVAERPSREKDYCIAAVQSRWKKSGPEVLVAEVHDRSAVVVPALLLDGIYGFLQAITDLRGCGSISRAA
jgi:hypothetical protein